MKQCYELNSHWVLFSCEHLKKLILESGILEKVNESSKWYDSICRKEGIRKQVSQFQSHCDFFFLLLLWQQNSPTDHNPLEREFNAATGNFMALPSAVLRITGVLLEVVLENERKNKVCAKYLNETGSYCSP